MVAISEETGCGAIVFPKDSARERGTTDVEILRTAGDS